MKHAKGEKGGNEGVFIAKICALVQRGCLGAFALVSTKPDQG